MSPALADLRVSSLLKDMDSVHPRVDLVTEFVGAGHRPGALRVVGRVHPTGVRVAPGPLQVGAVGERPAAGGLEQRVDGVDRALGAEHLVATYLQPQAERDLLTL